MKKVNLENRNEYYASDSLLETAKSKKSEVYVNLAYTDYGGTFLDKAMIAYFNENYPDNIISENTSWFGKNAFIFGDIAKELNECLQFDILSFNDFEDFYSYFEYDEYLNAANEFIKYKPEYSALKSDILDFFTENSRMETFGVDYCETDLIEYLNSLKS